jgi:hypothetical protein
MSITNPTLRIVLLAVLLIASSNVGDGFVRNSCHLVLQTRRVQCCWSSTLSTTAASSTISNASSPSSPSFDPKYYSPPDQSLHSRNGDNSPSRITLTRFLSQYVKDHPEVCTMYSVAAVVSQYNNR